MKRILLDTNFLLVPYQFKMDIFSQMDFMVDGPHELLLPTGVIAELRKLSRGKGKEGAAARFALKLIEVRKLKKVKSSGEVDGWLISYAKRKGFLVATNDKALRNRLKKEGVKAVVLRSRSGLEVV